MEDDISDQDEIDDEIEDEDDENLDEDLEDSDSNASHSRKQLRLDAKRGKNTAK